MGLSYIRFIFRACYRDPLSPKHLIKVFRVKGHKGKCGACNKKTNFIIKSNNERSILKSHNFEDIPIMHWVCSEFCMLKYLGPRIKYHTVKSKKEPLYGCIICGHYLNYRREWESHMEYEQKNHKEKVTWQSM